MDNAHIMVDIETLGTGSKAMLLSIGAARFDPMKSGHIEDSFYVVIDPTTAQPYGEIDAGTLLWWFHKDRDEPRHQLMDESMVDLGSALEGFRMWYQEAPGPVWGNGASFDNVILANAYKAIGDEPPWGFWLDRCYRTLKSLPGAPAMQRGEKTHHNALDDALAQALHMQEIVGALEIAV